MRSRKELVTENKILRERIAKLEAELEEWRKVAMGEGPAQVALREWNDRNKAAT